MASHAEPSLHTPPVADEASVQIHDDPPPPITQPDHFYLNNEISRPTPGAEPNIGGRRRGRQTTYAEKDYLDPQDDPLATRGIPVFKPTMEEFADFEGYMEKVECWGMKSGIVKVVPPAGWKQSLPKVTRAQLSGVKIASPIEQNLYGQQGKYHVENIVRRKMMSVREWVELTKKDEHQAPSALDAGQRGATAAASGPGGRQPRKSRRATTVRIETPVPPAEEMQIKGENVEDDIEMSVADEEEGQSAHKPIVVTSAEKGGEKKEKGRRDRQATQAKKLQKDEEFLDAFDPYTDWLPPLTRADDYTPEFCRELERQYWRNCGIAAPAWYGADTQGSLYSDETKIWNVAHLESALSRLLPATGQGLPGVNTPYLYWGMWRAAFAWHVEDMDLFSINYIHFGAPKYWYAIPQAKADAMERAMRGYFPSGGSSCSQFLRHKAYLASPSVLAANSCKPNCCVQHEGEFIITYPRGYHAGFNLGLNCAESVNFALESWIELGKKAKACECVDDSVKIDVDQLLRDRAAEAGESIEPSAYTEVASPVEMSSYYAPPPSYPSTSSSSASARQRKPSAKVASDYVPGYAPDMPIAGPSMSSTASKKRKASSVGADASASKRSKASSSYGPMTVTLKMPEPYVCCLCPSMRREGLLPVQDPPLGTHGGVDGLCMAHEDCAMVVPETWLDDVVIPLGLDSWTSERRVFGVDAIVKDRWNLKCAACSKARPKVHGAPIQCTKGKCPKAFHVSCAMTGRGEGGDGDESGIVFEVLREVEKEVVWVDPHTVVIGAGNSDPATVLKLVRKRDVSILCPQHNPQVAAAKKAGRQSRIREILAALPPMSRIKIRMSSGVFEVSLLRVIEETGSVEVLWDEKGTRREFKWGSVVLGNNGDSMVPQGPIVTGSVPSVSAHSVFHSTLPGQHLEAEGTFTDHYYHAQDKCGDQGLQWHQGCFPATYIQYN